MNPCRITAVLLLGLTVGLGAACGRVKEDKMASSLESATNGYRESIRWGYFDAAFGFVHPDRREDPNAAALGNIRVTGYDVIQPPVITPQNTAVQQVRIEYVLEDEQRLKSLIDRQDWHWDEDRTAWWLYSGLPQFSD